MLTGVGTQGDAVQKVRVTLAPTNRGFTCLKSAVHAGHNLKVTNATLDCDGAAGADHYVAAANATLTGDVRATADATGGAYLGKVETSADARTLPDAATVCDWYLARGTTIPLAGIPLGHPNVLPDGGFEPGVDAWSGSLLPTCAVARTTADKASGAASLAVTFRLGATAGPRRDVTGIVQNGEALVVQARAKMSSANDVNLRAALDVTNSSGSTQAFRTPDFKLKQSDGWAVFDKKLTPNWSGTLSSAVLRFETKSGDFVTDFQLDDLVVKEDGSDRTLYGGLLSPASNPFGGGTNPRGIYVIGCANAKLVVENLRIVGTLVVLNPGKDTAFGDGGALNWRPAVAGFPILMVREKDVTIDPGGGGLSEFWCNANFNPPGSPYDGFGEDADQADTYPSRLDGLIYGGHKLKFAGPATVNGAVVAAENVEITAGLTVRQDIGYYRSPPPGFSGPEQVRLLLDSARKPLD